MNLQYNSSLMPDNRRLTHDLRLHVQELQNDLEAEQVKVNSLTHMVVVVDENSGESATAALEEQLQVSHQLFPRHLGEDVFFSCLH